MFKFEKLDVWQEAINFSDEIYRCTSTFPDAERYGLVNQLRRSSVSIAANVAEGSGRSSSTDFARFVEIAYGSLMESVSHLASPGGRDLSKMRFTTSCICSLKS